MKKLFTFLFLVAICWQVCAQKALFIRVYNTSGKKINNGHILAVTDTSLQLEGKGTDTVNLPATIIGKIKTRHSSGHNALIGSAVGAGVVAIAGAASADPDAFFFGYTEGEGAVAGALLGIPSGALIGWMSALFKRSTLFIIDGDLTRWKRFATYFSDR